MARTGARRCRADHPGANWTMTGNWESLVMSRIGRYSGGLVVLGLLATSVAVAKSQVATPRAPRPDLTRLKWMAGCWQAHLDKDTVVEEDWTAPAGNLLLSTTRYFKKDKVTSFEFSKIEATDSATTFSASTEGKPFDTYGLKTLVDEYVAFENTKKSFPQRIIYRLASDGHLIPRNEGDGQPSVELRMRRVKCGGE
jgi:hypothetical protein